MEKEKRKLFFDRVKTFFYRNKMILIIGLSVLLLASLLFLGSTYGYYEENLELQNSVEMTVATLSYGMNEEYKVVVPAGEEVKVPIAVMELNNIATKYQMYYRSSDDLTKVIVGYASYSEYLPSGDLGIKESKRIDLILQNSGEDPVTIFIGVKGGYQNNRVEDIILGNGEIRITNRIESEEVEEDMATPEDILEGKKAWVNGSKITGTMPNRGELNWKQSGSTTYTVPKGYYQGGTLDSSGAYQAGYQEGHEDGFKEIIYTDPILIWQRIAGLNTTYQTVEEMDSQTLDTLMNNEDAVHYMLTSITLLNEVTTSSLAMKSLGASNMASILAITELSWNNAITKSEYLSEFELGNINNIGKTDKVWASSYYASNRIPAYAVDNNSGTWWLSNNNGGAQLYFDFDKPVYLYRMYLYGNSDNVNEYLKSYTLYGSNDNSTWVPLSSGSGVDHRVTMLPTEKYRYYKLDAFNSAKVAVNTWHLWAVSG